MMQEIIRMWKASLLFILTGARSMMQEIIQNKKGKNALLNLVVTVAVAILIMAVIVPVALEQFLGANTTGWQTSWVAIWNIIPIFAFVAFLLAMIYMATRRR